MVIGVAASPGLAIGPLFQFQATRIVVSDRPGDGPGAERRLLAEAIEAAREQLGDTVRGGARSAPAGARR